jgi:hypothetical protein
MEWDAILSLSVRIGHTFIRALRTSKAKWSVYLLSLIHLISMIPACYIKVHSIDHGAGAGINSDGNDGLSQLKRGWSSETRTAYFCGRIFNRKVYGEIVRASGAPATDYFPAYRKGELGAGMKNQTTGCMQGRRATVESGLAVDSRPYSKGV